MDDVVFPPGFALLLLITQLVGTSTVVLAGVWLGHFNGGFNWSTHLFDYHPMMMITGFIFLYGQAILSYRVLRHAKKTYVKVIHAVLHLAALTFVAVGLAAIFKHKGTREIFNSVHSWMGLATVALFFLQYVTGFVCFVYPRVRQAYREVYMSHHVYWGIAILAMAASTALTELNKSGSGFSTKGLIVKFLAVSVVVFILLVTYLVTKTGFKRIDYPSYEQSVTEYTSLTSSGGENTRQRDKSILSHQY